jgi:hypothetical protein
MKGALKQKGIIFARFSKNKLDVKSVILVKHSIIGCR